MDTRTRGARVHQRQTLLNYKHHIKTDQELLGALCCYRNQACSPLPGGGGQVLSTLLSNICSLDNKLDYVRLQQISGNLGTAASLLSQKHGSVTHTTVQLHGLTSFHANRNAALCRETHVVACVSTSQHKNCASF